MSAKCPVKDPLPAAWERHRPVGKDGIAFSHEDFERRCEDPSFIGLPRCTCVSHSDVAPRRRWYGRHNNSWLHLLRLVGLLDFGRCVAS